MDSFSNMNQKDQEKVVSKFINNAKKDQGNEIKLTTGTIKNNNSTKKINGIRISI